MKPQDGAVIVSNRSRPWFGLLYKCLLLIAVPWVATTVLVIQIGGLVRQADSVAQAHLASTKLLSAEEEFIINRIIAGATLVSYMAGHSDESERLHEASLHKEVVAFRQIEELMPKTPQRLQQWQREKELLVKDVRYHRRDMALPSSLPITMLFGHHMPNFRSELKRLDAFDDIAVADTENERRIMHDWRDLNNRLSQLLTFGAVGSALLTLALGAYFYGSIVARLRNTQRNALRINTRETLLPARSGSDEIGLVDEQIYLSAKRVRELQAYKEEMTTTIGHQFVGPLQTMDATLSNLRNEARLNQEGTQLADRVTLSLSRLLRLANQLLELDKLEDATFNLKVNSVEMQNLVDSACAAVETTARQKNITIVRRVENVQFEADSDRLMQVLVNLLVNAVKFSADGGEVTIEAAREGKNVNIKVIDHGRGIPTEFQSRLFERFAQASPVDAENNKGFGLGLSITKSIIDAHHGQISLRSESGRGTTWSISLPCVAEVSATTPANNSRPTRFSLLRWAITDARLRQKGLIVIGIPLVLQVFFICSAANSLQRAGAGIDRAAIARQCSADATSLTKAEVRQGMLAFFFFLFRDPWLLDEYQQRKIALAAELDRLQKFTSHVESKPAIDFAKELSAWAERMIAHPDTDVSAGKMAALSGGVVDIERQCEQLQQMLEMLRLKAAAATAEQCEQFARTQAFLNELMIACLASNCLLAWGLGLFVCRSISQRVGAIADNANRLAIGETLVEPETGNDEIAAIARSFYLNAMKLRQLEDFKQQLVGIIGHDLRTPLTALMGFFELLGSGAMGNLSAAQLELAESSLEEAHKLMSLIDNVLEIEKTKGTGVMPMPPVALSR